ncbi:MAG: LEA type 2 family protein [Desulfobacteraceae bacterium]|nr:LEA type 2 family protein [Desulfobacteraceae bacterium]
MILLSCTSLRQELIRKPGISFEGSELKDMSLFEATAIFRFRITNSNPMGLNIRNITYNLRLNGKKFIRGISDKDLRVRSAGEGVLELPIVIHYDDIFESSENIPETNKLGYDLSGTMDVGPFTLPYQAKGSLNMPKLPKLSLKTIRVSELSQTYASVMFEMDIDNANPFSLAIKRVSYAIRLGGNELFTGVPENISSLSPNSVSRLEIPAKINFLKLGYSFADILKQSSGVYEIYGEMSFDDSQTEEKKIPVSQSRKRSDSPIILRLNH